MALIYDEPCKQELTLQFIGMLADNPTAFEVGSDVDWHSLTFGWAIAKGLSPEDAYEFADYIRYDTDLG